LPRPDSLDDDEVRAERAHDANNCECRWGKAAEMAARCEGADKNPWILAMTCHPNPVT